MKDAPFDRDYDPAAYDRPSVAVDCVLFGIVDGRPVVLLTRRTQPPFAGHWALPGGFVAIDESLEAAAARVLAQKTGLRAVAVEQLHAFGAVDRDPRMRIIAIAYRALLAPADVAAVPVHAGQRLATIDPDGTVRSDGAVLTLAFDHGDIVKVMLAKLRGSVDRDALSLVADRFTLRELQEVHEAVLGRSLNKPAFRRRMLERGMLRATGDFEAGRAFRPAELYVQLPKG